MGTMPRMPRMAAKQNIILFILIQAVICMVAGSELSRTKRQQPSNMPSITDLDVSCEKSGMTVELTFSAPFNGIVFSKGHYSNPACRYVRRKSGQLRQLITVPLSGCGTSTVEASSDRLMIENTLIIQMDAMVQDIWDSARKITCDWQSKLEKVITFSPFGVADLKQVAEVKFAGSGDNVRTWMEIQFGRGPFAAPLEGLTKIGDELTVVVYAEDGGAGYDMMVKNCYAHDNRNFKRSNKIRLLNDHGCLFRPHQMEYFRRTFDVRSTGADLIAFARMNAFKFPDKMDVYLSCELELCKGGCDTHCEKADYPIDIIEQLSDRPTSRELPETEAVEITTFRPSKLKKILKGVKKRRKPKDFGPDFVQDDSVDILQPPKELSPELLQLLQDIGAVTEKASVALAQRTDSPPPAEDFFIEPTANRMSFSTIFGGTHTTSDNIPATILSNGRQFEPSQLLSASLDDGAPEISSFSRGVTGSNVFPVRMSIPEQTTTRFQPLDEINDGLHGPFFKLENLGETGLLNKQVQPHNNNKEIQNISNNIEVLDNTISTLQQQLQKEGSANFKPIINTTPNILSTTLIFTSPRSVEKLRNQLSENPKRPKQVLLKVIDSLPNQQRPPRNLGSIGGGRPRYGAKLESTRFRTKRESGSGDDDLAAQPDNVFAKESVNLVRNFQVVSSTDLAFQTNQLQDIADDMRRRKTAAEIDSEICFAETSFYAGLLVMCSLLLLSSLVSVCSIKQVRKYRQDEHGLGKRFFFGSHLRDAHH